MDADWCLRSDVVTNSLLLRPPPTTAAAAAAAATHRTPADAGPHEHAPRAHNHQPAANTEPAQRQHRPRRAVRPTAVAMATTSAYDWGWGWGWGWGRVGVGLGDPVAMATTGTVARVFSLRWPGVSDNAFVETVALPPLHTPSPPPLPSPILCSEPSAP